MLWKNYRCDFRVVYFTLQTNFQQFNILKNLIKKTPYLWTYFESNSVRKGILPGVQTNARQIVLWQSQN